MQKERDDLKVAGDRFRTARTSFERALHARDQGLDDDSGVLMQAVDELNLAHQLFMEAASRIFKDTE